MQAKKIEGLDTLRFFAFLSIFSHHTLHLSEWTMYGVDFFFVLSSFLLTYLALTEIEKKGFFSRKNFFVRRVLRIFPLYYLLVGFSLLLLPKLAGIFDVSVTLPKEPWKYWAMLSCYEVSSHIFALQYFWSIAVEEQFYVIFLGLSFFFRKHIGIPIFTLFLVAGLYMHFAMDYKWDRYWTLIPHFINFGMGMSAAWFFKNKSYKSKHVLILSILCLVAIPFFPKTLGLLYVLLSVFFASLILLSIKLFEQYKLRRYLNITEELGKYTYGLYMYSGFMITFGYKFLPPMHKSLQTFLILLLTIIVAYASYHLFEKHFLKLKKRFR